MTKLEQKIIVARKQQYRLICELEGYQELIAPLERAFPNILQTIDDLILNYNMLCNFIHRKSARLQRMKKAGLC